uniref:Bifunctional inhibitor/plant lipid transfer protein/seed storage helical domain-containing protein n=1 Tax=Solanum lycopersicum TaxID=4081 RepID=A0A3Q7FG71_SOLLC
MKKGSSIFAIFFIAMLVILLGELLVVESINCNAMELVPCAPAIIWGQLPPLDACCAKLKEQVPCLCIYFKDPMMKPYVDSPNAKKVFQACGVTTPKC